MEKNETIRSLLIHQKKYMAAYRKNTDIVEASILYFKLFLALWSSFGSCSPYFITCLYCSRHSCWVGIILNIAKLKEK